MNNPTDLIKQFNKVWFYQIKEDGTIKIVMYKGNEIDIIVPDNINGTLVTELGEYVFSPNRTRLSKEQKDLKVKINSIVIPDSIKRIGPYCFSGCSQLTNVKLSNNMTVIGGRLFQDCVNLADLNLPNGIKRIYDNAFENCTNLTNLDIPNNVEYIGPRALINSSIKKIRIPKQVTVIKEESFKDCSNLEKVYFDGNIEIFEQGCFDQCTKLKEITIPDSTKKIYSGSFCDCENLSEVIIPEGVEKIGTWAFYSDELGVKKISILGKKTILERTFLNWNKDIVICGQRKSTAENYAKKEKLEFQPLN